MISSTMLMNSNVEKEIKDMARELAKAIEDRTFALLRIT